MDFTEAALTSETRWGESLTDFESEDHPWLFVQSGESRAVLRSDVSDLCERLYGEGVRPKSTVMLRMVPSLTYLKLLLALWRIGAQVIVLDYRTPRTELGKSISLLNPQFVVESEDSAGPTTGVRGNIPFDLRFRTDGKPNKSPACLVQFSSGSTGKPKIIGRTVQSLHDEIERHSKLDGFIQKGERVLILNSIAHTMGLVTGFLCALRVGATVVLPTTHRPAEVLRLAQTSEVNAIFGVPTHFELMTRTRDIVQLPSLRLAVCGGEQLSLSIYDDFYQRYGVHISQVYGVTETGLLSGDLHGTRPPSVGPLLHGVNGKIVENELHIKLTESPYLLHDQPDRYTNGWLRTFDRINIDGNTGHLHIHGRLDSLVTIGGIKIDLMEVELALMTHPEVTEAVVLFDGAIKAFLGTGNALPTATELVNWCQLQLSPVMIPRTFHMAPVLPRNRAGKLVRNQTIIEDSILLHTDGDDHDYHSKRR